MEHPDLKFNYISVFDSDKNAIKDMINRIENPNCPKDSTICSDSPKNEAWWGRPDLNRGPERPRLRA
jgi:hypothetical protein